MRLEDGEAGLAARTIARRLSSVSRPVRLPVGARRRRRGPQPGAPGMAARRPGARPGHGGVPLIRTPRTLPRVLLPAEVDALLAALRTHRDRAMVEAMVLGGLRRCEVLGLRLEDVNAGERRLFIAEGKGGRPADRAGLGPVLRLPRRLPGQERPGGPTHRPGLRGAQGPRSRRAAVGRRGGRDPRRRPGPRRADQGDLPPAAPHLFHPAAGSRHGPRGDPGSGRARLDRVDPHLPAPGQRLAGAGVHARAQRRSRPRPPRSPATAR